MQSIIQKSNLPTHVCADLWELINPNGDETFTKAQFFMIMFLMKKAQDGVKVPPQLPADLKRTAGYVDKTTSQELVIAEPPQ